MDESNLVDYEREVKALIASSGINQAIKLHEVIHNYETVVLVTEYLEGNNLADYAYMNNMNTFEENHAKNISFNLVKGLSKLHDRNILHRDLKLENVFMSSEELDSVPKIGDFGLSIKLERGESCSDMVGSMGYTAPEILKGDEYGLKADVFSLGCLLYVMITRELPFYSETL